MQEHFDKSGTLSGYFKRFPLDSNLSIKMNFLAENSFHLSPKEKRCFFNRRRFQTDFE
jgi:hypothetical protein